MVKKMTKYNVYQVPKKGKPLKIVGGLTRLQARKVTKVAREGKTFFVGYKESGKKVTNKSTFSY
jgi:hypothetical protein|tara:strand:+ start:1904 stop:2095 length:192 start_codon:yes stop_codon:yes gene_type:complete